MARLSVLFLFLVLVSAITFTGVAAEENTGARLGGSDNSFSHLIDTGEVISRKRRAEKKKISRKKPSGQNSRKNRYKFEKRRRNRLARNKRVKGKRNTKNGRNTKNIQKTKKKKGGKKGGKNGGKGKKRPRNRQSSCSSTEVSLTCMENAMEGMKFEKNQITNYLKQAKRLENHEQISTNKVGKKGEFEEAKKHLLWAIGGDINDPKCGPNTTAEKNSNIDYDYEKTLALKGLALLANCSVAIEAACNTSKLAGYDGEDFAKNMTICRSMMDDAIGNSKRCQEMTESSTEQCNCWANQTKLVLKIKQFDCLAKKTQKLVTKHKEECKDVFKECKKQEDASVEAVYSCMDDHSMNFINQSLDSLALAAVDGTKSETRFRGFHLLSF